MKSRDHPSTEIDAMTGLGAFTYRNGNPLSPVSLPLEKFVMVGAYLPCRHARTHYGKSSCPKQRAILQPCSNDRDRLHKPILFHAHHVRQNRSLCPRGLGGPHGPLQTQNINSETLRVEADTWSLAMIWNASAVMTYALHDPK